MEHAWLAGMPTITPQGCGHPPKELASPCTGESVPPDDSIKFNGKHLRGGGNQISTFHLLLVSTATPQHALVIACGAEWAGPVR
jgi:hypothetical protein